jgi:hypothetical protein
MPLPPLALRRARRRLLGCAAGAALALPSVAAAAPFSSTSVWNAPLSASAPLDPDSAALVSDLQRQVATYGPWINTTQYSVPIYKVPSTQPRVKVTLDKYNPELQQAFDAVPLPDGAKPAAGWDKHLVVWQGYTDTMWEFWALSRKTDGWHAGWGAKIVNVSKSIGVLPSPLGATATGLPLVGGLMRPFELSERWIPHALALGVPNVRSTVFAWPATRTDGVVADAAAIPAGTRFRLPASLDVSALGLSPAVKAMAAAAQRYGIVVRDTSSAVTFYAEDPTPTGTNPYPALFGTGWMDQALASFPWSRLQVVAPPAVTPVAPNPLK